jgi:uncharacterized protein (TIGR03435 family)
MLTVATMACAAVAAAQSPVSRPVFDAFEVAAIKPTPSDWRGGRFAVMQGVNQFVARAFTLKHLIAAAYLLNPRAISGGASWIDADPYDILARTPGNVRPTVDEQNTMLRRLLTDRFALSFHREQKQLGLYALRVAKGGSRMKPAAMPEDAPVLINRVFS